MARYLYSGCARDGNGNIISSAQINVYRAGTTTAATVYAAAAGGTSVAYVASGTDGTFSFYVDDTEYYQSQKFKIIIAKAGYTSSTFDNLAIFPVQPLTIVTSLPLDSVGTNGDMIIFESGVNHYFVWKAGDKWWKIQGTAVT